MSDLEERSPSPLQMEVLKLTCAYSIMIISRGPF
jgi:hypothetical protein